jgi:hypothetical protein
MGCEKIQLALVIAGIIHMLIEYALGKRSQTKGGPGSVLALFLTLVSLVASVVVGLYKKYKNRG